MRGDTHAGCGERSGETGPWQHRHRAPDRLNSRMRRTPARRHNVSNARLMFLGSRGVPFLVVNTRPSVLPRATCVSPN